MNLIHHKGEYDNEKIKTSSTNISAGIEFKLEIL
jgi:hypothetical protein